VSRQLVPAARTANEINFPAYSTLSTGYGADTPVYDALVAEYRTDFRTVPGDPWGDFPTPQITRGDRFTLPGGGSFAY
jgi:hypothetical protein